MNKCITGKGFVFAWMMFAIGALCSFAATPRYPFKADLILKTSAFMWEGNPGISIKLFNDGTTLCDSLQLRLYMNATPEEMSISHTPDDTNYQFAGRMDILIYLTTDGLQRKFEDTERATLYQLISSQRPQKMVDFFDSAAGKFIWCFPVDISRIRLEPGCALRLDLIWDSRSPFPPYGDLLNQAPEYSPGDSDDWSWGAKLRANGFPADFGGIPDLSRDSIDYYWRTETNPYVAVFRHNELLWGLPPDWKKYYDEDFDTISRPRQDPMPYAPIAVPFGEYAEQLQRDSANLKLSRVRVNQAGYCPGNKNFFYYIGSSASTFTITNTADGSTAATGALVSTGLSSSGQLKMTGSWDALTVVNGEKRYTIESSLISGTLFEGTIPDLPEGRYKIITDSSESAPFVVRADVYNMVKDALLKFYGANRCGDAKSWFHPPCHLHDPVTGGWHDCGDHLKEGATMAYTAAVTALAAAVFSDRDQDVYDADQSKTRQTDGIPDILYEAKHGADFILQSYDKAGGDVAKMITSVGDFGGDHAWWGPPELQDYMPAARGGPPRPARNEVGADYLGGYAANLAFVSKRIRPYDAAYADRCLRAAKDLYEFSKTNQVVSNTPAYTGSTTVADDIAFAALGLLWATGERKYLDELCFDATIGTKAADSAYPKALFEGGWFARNDPVFYHSLANTDWGSVHTHVLWGFFRLILNDKEMAAAVGLTEPQRCGLIEKTIYTMIANCASIGQGIKEIELPQAGLWTGSAIKYDLPWFTMHTQMEWVWNRYQAGNITEMYYYYDIASKVQGLDLPNTPATADWKADTVKTILIRMLDYMLGVNPWDISMISGIGYKNFNHPLHRAANPELRNTQVEYDYRHLVGSFTGGYPPTTSLYTEYVADYFHSESGINGTTNILMPVCGLSCVDRKVNARNNQTSIRPKIIDVRVVPGAVRGTFSVRSDRPIASVAAYSLSGRIVARQDCRLMNTCSVIVKTNERGALGSGLYVVRVNLSDGGSATRKVAVAER